MNLTEKRCVPCEGGVPKLDSERVAELLRELPGWRVEAGRLRRTFQFRDFKQAMAFVNRMADTAEQEGHHPDFTVHYSRVEVELWTHAADGLTENDFILAAKIGKP
ncbi:MAG: 4a-hydroxytetrahydrobiopterin dehydratase [Myxococcales bacterium]